MDLVALTISGYNEIINQSQIALPACGSYRRQAESRDAGKRSAPMRILVSGSTGMIGSSLTGYLIAKGHTVRRLVRRFDGLAQDELPWDPYRGRLDGGMLEGFDAVVHLAGNNIAGGRWTEKHKRLIRESRVRGTELLAATLGRLSNPPQVLVSASAIGYYGDRGKEPLREDSGPGGSFMAGVCQEWERATLAATERGTRVVQLRMGLVLSARGGALGRMLPPFKMGIGGKMGSGRQFVSWIALDDLMGVFDHVIGTGKLHGPVNAVAPQAVTNEEFSRTLGRVLSRPAVFPLPAFVLRLALGEMADELLLFSSRVEPAQLLASGYSFRFPQLELALRHVLGK